MDQQQLQLPVGFRFLPTDEELLFHFLRRKLCSSSASIFNNVIPTVPHPHVFRTNPWDLPGDLKEKRYFFCKRKGTSLSWSWRKCSASSGFWKHSVGKDKQIRLSAGGTGTGSLVIGMKKSFVFHLFHHHEDESVGARSKTQWVMTEFCLVISSIISAACLKTQMGDWVVCCVYTRRIKSRMDQTKKSTSAAAAARGGGGDAMNLNMNMNRMGIVLGENSSSSSSCSSGITDLDEEEEEEEASS